MGPLRPPRYPAHHCDFLMHKRGPHVIFGIA